MAVIDPSLAATHHLGIGDVLPVQSRMLRIVGTTTGPGSFMIGMVSCGTTPPTPCSPPRTRLLDSHAGRA